MRMRLAIALCALATALTPAAPAAARGTTMDLSMRRAVYFTGAKTDSIDTRAAAKGGDPYVVEGGTMLLKKSQATKCVPGACYFNFGFIAFRTPAAGAFSTYAVIRVLGKGIVGNNIHFGDKEATRQGVVAVRLPPGEHKLTFEIDALKKTQESNEENNTLTVTIIVIN